ncbi:MAG: efflux RND transporter periplasmic adaptor subunit [Myxococcales bacterium]|nr:efflux RND transporter periplasmic adaptor subunit [Myxococcales bacterium]
MQKEPKRDEHHDPRVWLKRGAVAALCVAVAVAFALAWMPKRVRVDAVRASRGELESTVSEVGRARVKDRFVVSAPIAGRLARIELHAGDVVKKGTVLARVLPVSAPLLDPRSRAQAEAQVAVAKAAVSQAKAGVARAEASKAYASKEADRLSKLAAQKAVASEAVERAELEARTATEALTSAVFGVRVAEHELAMANAALGRLAGGGAADQFIIESPVDGQVLRILEENEGVVQPGHPLLEVGDPAALEVVVDVLTSDAVRIHAGQHARLRDWGGAPLEGRVRTVEPSAFTKPSALGVEEQRVNVVLDLHSPREIWATLGDGYRVEVEIVVWSAHGVIRIPSTAVFPREDGWAVFVVRDGVAETERVTLGERGTELVELKQGIREGDRVIDHPSEQIEAGTRVSSVNRQESR